MNKHLSQLTLFSRTVRTLFQTLFGHVGCLVARMYLIGRDVVLGTR